MPRVKQLATSVAAIPLLSSCGSPGLALRSGSGWFINGSDSGKNTKIVCLGSLLSHPRQSVAYRDCSFRE